MCRILPFRRRTQIAIGTAALLIWCVFSVWFFNYYYANREPVYEPIAPVEMQFRRNFTEQKENILQVVHIDLKGSPPKMMYLENLLFTLSRAGVAAVMIEYDDMFPYDGELTELSALSAYSKKDILEIVQLCNVLNIEIIPMIQTFGHMEHALKLSTYEGFREDHIDKSAICPTFDRSLWLIEEMIKQILKLHPFSIRIHIGCDNVTSINQCQNCKRRQLPTEAIFVQHVKAVATFIRRNYANVVTPLIWDNMLRPMSSDFLQTSNIDSHVEVVLQDSNSPISQSIREEIWHKYTTAFKKIWIAGAFKGADGAFSLLPNLQVRLENQDSWLDFIFNEVDPSTTTIVGYILTGSSKPDHFASSIDLLPVSLPSLLMNALRVRSAIQPHQIHYYLKEYSDILDCKPSLWPMEAFNLKALIEKCDFKEKHLLDYTMQFLRLQPDVDRLFKNLRENNSWLTPFHVKRNFLNVVSLDEIYHEHHFYETYSDFFQLHTVFKNEMRNFYKEHVVEEWFEMHVETFVVKLRTLHNLVMSSVNFETFRRRE